MFNKTNGSSAWFKIVGCGAGLVGSKGGSSFRGPGFNADRHKTLSLNLPNVEFNFDVTVDIIQVLTDTSKSNLMVKWGLIIACKWVFDVCVRSCILSTYTDTLKTLHWSWMRCLVFSVIEAYDHSNHFQFFLKRTCCSKKIGVSALKERII